MWGRRCRRTAVWRMQQAVRDAEIRLWKWLGFFLFLGSLLWVLHASAITTRRSRKQLKGQQQGSSLTSTRSRAQWCKCSAIFADTFIHPLTHWCDDSGSSLDFLLQRKSKASVADICFLICHRSCSASVKSALKFDKIKIRDSLSKPEASAY